MKSLVHIFSFVPLVGVLAVLSVPAIVFAAPVTINNPIQLTIEGIFLAILDIIMVFAVPIVVFFIILAGFHYVTAQGNPTKLEQANNALLYAVIGGVIVLGAQIILAVITNTVSVFG